jgi:UrcA family protein
MARNNGPHRSVAGCTDDPPTRFRSYVMNSPLRYVRSALTTAAAVIALTVSASNAFAAPPVDPSTTRTENLTLAGLDLSQAADVQIARERIHQIAQNLCEQVRDPLSLSQHQAFMDCVAHATAKAEPKLQQLASAQTATIKLAALQR